MNSGLPLDVIERHRRDGLSYEQQAQAVSAMIARGGSLDEIIGEETGTIQPEDSRPPFAPFVPFEPPDTAKLPAFPVEHLPPILKEMAIAAAESIQVSVDMTAVSILTVTSLCVQGKFIINPKPGWVEPVNLYTAVIARPSDRKTPVLDLMTRPIHTYEREENETRAPLVEAHKMKRDILTKQITNMKELAAKPTTKGKAVDLDEITELQYQLADLDREVVKPLRLLTDDVTQEALVSLMSANDGRMGLFSDEGGIFDTIAGRYSSGRANLDVFLKAYSGSYLRVDRQGRPSEVIEHPTLTMLLMLQPSVLENIVGNSEFSGRGLLARFLFSFPSSTVGHRVYDSPPMPEGLEDTYNILLHGLLSIPDTGEPKIITLTAEAHAEAGRFFESLENRLADDLNDGDIEAWAGKLHGQIMRIAGIIHCCLYMNNAAQTPVSLETMRAAEHIGLYFLEHAKVTFKMAGLSEGKDVRDAKYILKRLDGQDGTTKRELHQRCKGKFPKVEDMEPGLKVLIDHGYIAVENIRTGRRPTEKIRINPDPQNPQYTQNTA